MVRIPEFDPIYFLLDHELPLPRLEPAYGDAPIQYATAQRMDMTDADLVRLKLKRERRCVELQKLSIAELKSLVEIAQHELQKENIKEAKDLETKAFFNQSTAKPDYEYWSRLAIWTLEEAAALMIGRAPELVNWKRLEGHNLDLRRMNLPTSPFVSKYQKLYEAIHRAQLAGELNETISPFDFVAWADAKGFRIPRPLLRAVTQSNRASVAKSEFEAKFSSRAKKRQAIHEAVMSLWPKGIPEGMMVQTRNTLLIQHIEKTDRHLVPGEKTIGRYFKSEKS